MLANHGSSTKYDHQVVGYNSRLDELQAAILRIKLKHLDEWNAQRVAIARLYQDLLAGSTAVELLAEPASHITHVYHLYIVRLALSRDRALAALRAAGVEADIHYPQALPLVPAHRDLGSSPLDFPMACRHAASALSLPMFPGMQENQIEQVVMLLLAGLKL
jgi:dTDP-4-amino-4,6-dideoxygalactose transaminase